MSCWVSHSSSYATIYDLNVSKRKYIWASRDLNPDPCGLDPKSSASANSATRPYACKDSQNITPTRMQSSSEPVTISGDRVKRWAIASRCWFHRTTIEYGRWKVTLVVAFLLFSCQAN